MQPYQKIKQLLCLALCLLILLSQTGCTIMGAAIGARADRNNPRQIAIDKDKLHRTKPGVDIRLVFRDGKILDGEYVGYSRLSDAEYARLLGQNDSQVLRQMSFPGPETPALITRDNGHQFTAFLTGVDYDSLVVWVPEDSTRNVLPIKSVKYIERPGTEDGAGAHVFDMAMLRKLLDEHDLPLASVISIRTEAGVKQIPIDEIQHVQILKRGATNMIIGTLVGLTGDCLILLLIALSQMGDIYVGGCK
jgi:hypothetical protein